MTASKRATSLGASVIHTLQDLTARSAKRDTIAMQMDSVKRTLSVLNWEVQSIATAMARAIRRVPQRSANVTQASLTMVLTSVEGAQTH